MMVARVHGRRVAVAIAVGVAALAVVLAVVIIGRGGGTADVVKDYFDGKRAHDCSYIDLLSAQRTSATDQASCTKDPDAYFSDVVAPEGSCADFDLELGDEEIDGDSATVDYEVVSQTPGCEDAGIVYLVHEGGEWKVDHL